MVLDPHSSEGALGYPRLVHVQGRRVLDFYPPAVLGLDHPLLLLCSPRRRFCCSTPTASQAHAARGDGGVPGLLELPLDLAGYLLLAELHLGDGVVDGLADDLVREEHELLGAGRQRRAHTAEVLLGEPDALGAREGLVLVAHHLHHLLAQEAHAPARVRVVGAFHVLLHLGPRRGHVAAAVLEHGLLILLPLLRGFFTQRHHLGLLLLPPRVLDLLVEDGGALRAVQVPLRHYLLAVAPGQLLG